MLRSSILRHPWLAALLLALALAVRMLVPAGYMLQGEARVITITICAESLGRQITRPLAIPAKPTDPAKARMDAPCAFTVLTLGATGASAGFAALALLFVLVPVFALPLPAAPRRLAYVRPPARAPPLRG